MHARIVAVGERMPAWVETGFEDYRRRLAHDLVVELHEIRVGARGKSADPARAIAQEGRDMLAAVPRDTQVIALDGQGRSWSSEKLASRLADWRMSGRNLAFLIGGPDGHDATVLQRADESWSLGPLTLPHMLVRLVLIEQLYRATTILAGHPYHRGRISAR